MSLIGRPTSDWQQRKDLLHCGVKRLIVQIGIQKDRANFGAGQQIIDVIIGPGRFLHFVL